MTDELVNALDDCLRRVQGGESPEAALARYPALAADLQPLLEAARQAQPSAEAQAVPRQAQRASRAAFLTRAMELREARSNSAAWLAWPRSFSRALASGLAVLLVVVVGTYGVVSVSASSLPGEQLYGLKRTVENLQLALALNPEAHAALEAEFESRRVQETERVLNDGREVEVEFRGTITALLGDLWRVGNFNVHIRPNTPVDGTPAVGLIAKVVGVSQRDGTVEAQRVVILEPIATATPVNRPTSTLVPTERPAPSSTMRVEEEVEFTGVLVSMAGDIWTIDTQLVSITRATEIRGDLRVGQTVEVRAIRAADGALIALRIRVKESNEGPSTPQPGEARTPVGEPTSAPTQTSGGGGSGPSPSNTPRVEPTQPPGSGGGSGPSPSNTPRPTETPEPTREQEPREVEFEGVVESTGGVWVISGQSVSVDGNTEIRGNPQVGDMVRVKAWQFPDGRLLAERIEKR